MQLKTEILKDCLTRFVKTWKDKYAVALHNLAKYNLGNIND